MVNALVQTAEGAPPTARHFGQEETDTESHQRTRSQVHVICTTRALFLAVCLTQMVAPRLSTCQNVSVRLVGGLRSVFGGNCQEEVVGICD